MAETTIRTLVCSVMFIDLVQYSKRSVTEQQRMKQTFNEFLARALEGVPPRDFILLDTGDGAAIAFTGDPEDALAVGIALRNSLASLPPETLSARMGINLGPVKVVWDLNAHMNVIGDGINVAERVMGFAEPGQLLASRSFYDVVSRLSKDYGSLFSDLGKRTDKHVREHEVYAVAEGVRFERRGDARQKARGRLASPDDTNLDLFTTAESAITPANRRAPPQPGQTPSAPAKVFETGANLIVSASSKMAVEEALAKLAKAGAKLVSQISQTGNKWMASCTNPKVDLDACKVEHMGLMRIVSGPSREAVDEKVKELLHFGAKLVRAAELADGVWTAVCDTGGR
jgi:class 3 adenylate cyclase